MDLLRILHSDRMGASVSDILIRIKRAVLAGHYAFSEKARLELESDRLTELDVAESILNAVTISSGPAGVSLYHSSHQPRRRAAVFERETAARNSRRCLLLPRVFEASDILKAP